MVTKVEAKMYFPGYYSIKEISNAGYGGWSLPRENGPLKTAQHYGLYLSPPPQITDGLEKEKLRRTIMKHESIFRHQVHELHRLYGKQRDLMNEIRSRDGKRTWWRTAAAAYGGPPSSSSADVARERERPRRRLFDLEAPAEECMDIDDNGADLRTCDLADLNEPVEIDLGNEVFSEEQSRSQTHVYANFWSAAKQLSENKNEVIGDLRLKNESSDKSSLTYSVQAANFNKRGESTRVKANTTVKVPVKRKIFGVEVAEGNNDASSLASKAIDVAEPEEPLSTLPRAKPETALPWLRAASKEERERPALSPIQDSPSATRVREAENTRVEPSLGKILGFPIFDLAMKPDGSAAAPDSPKGLLAKESPCVRHQVIDLNECAVEEEAPTGIDLEAPVAAESLEDDAAAAEALVSIARSRPRGQSLSLLADVTTSLRGGDDDDDMDEFERIVLDLPETAQVGAAAPPAPEGGAAAVGPARRRARGRRGRQRARDFRSEVLPGMASLSRSEVAEDLQAFEGLVRAAGGAWQSSLVSPRSGCGGRGRRRSGAAYAAPEEEEEEQGKLWCGEAGIEETRLVAGWGKRTRRPPRQRCPITNSLLPLK